MLDGQVRDASTSTSSIDVDEDVVRLRFDTLREIQEQIRAADQKAYFLATFYTAVLGAALLYARYVWPGAVISRSVLDTSLAILALISLVVLLATFGVSFYHFIEALRPREGSRVVKNFQPSAFHWRSIGAVTLEQFRRQASTTGRATLADDLLRQIHTVSQIARDKYDHVDACYGMMKLLIASFVCFMLALQFGPR